MINSTYYNKQTDEFTLWVDEEQVREIQKVIKSKAFDCGDMHKLKALVDQWEMLEELLNEAREAKEKDQSDAEKATEAVGNDPLPF